MAHDQGPCDLEEVSLGMADIIDPIPRRQQAIGLLDQIVRIDAGKASPRQPGSKRWFMRQYLAQQPARPPLIEMMAHQPCLSRSRPSLEAKLVSYVTARR